MVDADPGRRVRHNHGFAIERAHRGSAHRDANNITFDFDAGALKQHPVAHAKLFFLKDEKTGEEVRNNRLGAQTHCGGDNGRRDGGSSQGNAEVLQQKYRSQEVQDNFADVDKGVK